MEVWLAFGQNLSNNTPEFILLFVLILISLVRREKLGVAEFIGLIITYIFICLLAALFGFNLA